MFFIWGFAALVEIPTLKYGKLKPMHIKYFEISSVAL
jgi:hypothetical protein